MLPVQPRRLDRVDHVFTDHDLKAAAVWANVKVALIRCGGCRWLWLFERELRARRMRVRSPRGDYWLPFLPDAYLKVIYPNDDVQACLVEIDMGTHAAPHRAKCKPSRLLLAAGLFDHRLAALGESDSAC